MSTRPRIYLDWNATAPLCDAARAAIAEVLADAGNPSSVHAEGRRARERVERARAAVATLAGRPKEQVVFTSGGSEANALGVAALAAVAEARGLPRVVAASPIDHPSLAGPVELLVARGWELRRLPVTPGGRVWEGDVRGFGLLVASAVHHELGTIADLVGLQARAAEEGALVHIDAVQALGKLDAWAFGAAHALATSAHKLGGPTGAGALAIAVDDALPLVPGGHQERGRRPGTENVLGIVGFGAAAAAADPAAWARVAALGERLERGLAAIAGTRVHGSGEPRIGGTTLAAFAGARGQDVVIALDLAGIAASTGAACTSGTVRPSPALLALGVPPGEALEAVRFSLGPATTESEIDEALRVLPSVVERARLHR